MRKLRIPLLVLLTAVSVGLCAPLAFAQTDSSGPDLVQLAPTTIDEKRALAREIQDRIEANGMRISALAEELNGAEYRISLIEADIAQLDEAIAQAEDEVSRRHDDVNRRARTAYKRAAAGGALDFLDIEDPAERNMHAKFTGAVAASDAEVVEALQAAQADLEDSRSQQEELRDDAEAERDGIAENLALIQEANANQAYLLSNVNAEIQALIDEERAAREAAAADGAPVGAPAAPGAPGGGQPTGGDAAPGLPPAPAPLPPTPPAPPPTVPPPPPTSKADIAVQFAYAQLGKWYCYGGNGWGRGAPFNCPPDTYDCSGLVMRAWGAAGVSMPHYSGAQYSMFPKVALDKLAPGDLVFWGPGGSQHVGIYIGNGQMIEAPHTGAQVRIASIWNRGTPFGAVRPG